MTERYTAASGVSWSVEKKGVLVVAQGGPRMLSYPEAAIWDLLVRGDPIEQVAEKLAAIARISAGPAEVRVRESVAAWRDEGLLTARGTRG